MEKLGIGRAINRALCESMRDDDTVVLLGEDIGKSGGSFGVTRNLLQEFGPARVLDTPISEAAITNLAVGAAMSGLKPVLEIMFMDFLTLSMDALVNQAAKAHFMFGGQYNVPLVVRTPHGAGVSAGPQHSQCLEGWLAHTPGLKVVVPSNSTDAYHLLKASIADPNPVIFVENKANYGRRFDFEKREAQPLGTARVVCSGDDVSIVTWGSTVWLAEEANELLQAAAEIIDLRTIQPWDESAVLTSLKKTRHLVVLHEAVGDFGPGAEIAARMAHIGFDYLDGPIIRVGSAFTPVPFQQQAERAYLPDARDVFDACLQALS